MDMGVGSSGSPMIEPGDGRPRRYFLTPDPVRSRPRRYRLGLDEADHRPDATIPRRLDLLAGRRVGQRPRRADRLRRGVHHVVGAELAPPPSHPQVVDVGSARRVTPTQPLPGPRIHRGQRRRQLFGGHRRTDRHTHRPPRRPPARQLPLSAGVVADQRAAPTASTSGTSGPAASGTSASGTSASGHGRGPGATSRSPAGGHTRHPDDRGRPRLLVVPTTADRPRTVAALPPTAHVVGDVLDTDFVNRNRHGPASWPTPAFATARLPGSTPLPPRGVWRYL